MNIVEAFRSPLSEKAEYLLDIYKDTNKTVAKSTDLDAQILAYNEAVSRCLKGKCHPNDEAIRNSILYWAYHNIGDSLVKKNLNSGYEFETENFEKALQYYRAALPLASSDEDTVHSMRKIANVHQHMHDESSWFDVRRKLIDYLPNSEKRHAYVKLANEFPKSEYLPALLEDALDYVKYEGVPAKIQYRNIIYICERLAKVYAANGNKEKLKKAQDLCDKAKHDLHLNVVKIA